MTTKSFIVPCWCPQCGMLMKGDRSTSTFFAFGVCSICFIFFVEGREERWNAGQRPSPEEISAMVQKIQT